MAKKRGKVVKKPISKQKRKIKFRKASISKVKKSHKIKPNNHVLKKFFSQPKPIKKEQEKKQIVSQLEKKEVKINKPEIKKQVENNVKKKKNNFTTFLLIIAIILGTVACYIFANIYVYSVTGIVIVYLILLIVLKAKKAKKEIPKQVKEVKPLIKPEYVKITYKTDFDNFYDFIKTSKKITVTKIALHFKMPKKQVEEWARILEEHRLIKINYPLLGDQELIYEG